MDKLADFISNLPLDDISDALSSVTLWWSSLVENISPEMLPLYAYVGFSIIVLLLWLLVARVLPKPLGAISWIAIFAVLFTPSSAATDTGTLSGDIAPSSIVAVYGLLMNDTGLVLRSIVPILAVFTVGLILGFIWQLIRSIIDANAQDEKEQAIRDEKANLQLATANYIDIVEHEAADTKTSSKQSKLIKTKK